MVEATGRCPSLLIRKIPNRLPVEMMAKTSKNTGPVLVVRHSDLDRLLSEISISFGLTSINMYGILIESFYV